VKPKKWEWKKTPEWAEVTVCQMGRIFIGERIGEPKTGKGGNRTNRVLAILRQKSAFKLQLGGCKTLVDFFTDQIVQSTITQKTIIAKKANNGLVDFKDWAGGGGLKVLQECDLRLGARQC